ncbi:hypothetical protein [Longimicrobium sp.]|uniref:hypothetical protein n=1 Tax=Longimicrobium sp. TaxID=2029185 RepID=UPI002B962E4E|nr:hypothetical protein [Longimicrobium sp.]HSU14821.1 hypothetical protein [Longimicrobium sp.]
MDTISRQDLHTLHEMVAARRAQIRERIERVEALRRHLWSRMDRLREAAAAAPPFPGGTVDPLEPGEMDSAVAAAGSEHPIPAAAFADLAR